jgi:methyl-accepting chemotaxis protein
MKRAADLSIGQRLGLGFGAVLLLIVLQIGASVLWLGRIDALQQRETQWIRPHSELADEVELGVLRQALDLRNYALTHSTQDLQAYTADVARTQSALHTLQGMHQDPNELPILEQILQAAGERQRAADDYRALVEQGADPGRLDKAEEMLSQQRVALFDRVRAYVDIQDQDYMHTQVSILQAQHVMSQGVLGLAALVLIASGFTAFLTVRAVRRPASALLEAARSMEGGDYAPALALGASTPGGTLGGPPRDELSELAQAFGHTALELGNRERLLEAGARLSTSLASTLELERLADAALRVIVEQVRAELGAIYVREAEGEGLRCCASFAMEGAPQALGTTDSVPGAALARSAADPI